MLNLKLWVLVFNDNFCTILCKYIHICLLMLITKNLSLVYMLKAEADASLHFMYFDNVCSEELSSTKLNSILAILTLWKC
ncbi:hypothetical protein BDA96_02G286300 [Sorghum bicolor]|jgi:hypothetical protein|uniref:Uncharacterized protein n=2 Tax=Sorghum bicolor TaxID=4558 RepID=A0A921RR36_SORBI|nr:hypothetical protein BDA96_02G286300 [Sorghum bicolor]KXG36046.1 hypothetical protein SORBI_3002G272200 [Sorghum bicolor]